MPRQAHGRSLHQQGPAKSVKRKPARGKALNALEIAERENPDQIKIPRHRLGEIDDDSDDPPTRGDPDEISSKRRKIDTEADGNSEQPDGGSDLEGNEWHVGVEDEDEDSDIDSDEAFGESDEERFSGFAFRGSEDHTLRHVKSRGRFTPRAKVSSIIAHGDSTAPDEGDTEDFDSEDDLGEDAVDLATALDMNAASEEEEISAGRKRKLKEQTRVGRGRSDSEGSSRSDEEHTPESDEEADELSSQFSVSDDEGDDAQLQDFVQRLGSKPATGPSNSERQRPLSLTSKPSQFGLGSSKISAADLMQYIKDPQQRQSLKVLQNSERNGPENYTGGIPGKLAPPLAKRQQDRLDRGAAYDESKKELEKWTETVKRNRRAEHLSFPLADPSTVSAASVQQLKSISSSQPMTSLETKIQEIMRESGLATAGNGSTEQQEQAYEELQERKMTLEEVQAHRTELRKARDLMFREEVRARRIKKIKSKAYRRVHRKERGKAGLEERALLAAQGLINSDEEREQNDRRRAEERMGARQRESKWAKTAKQIGRAAWDDEARGAVADMARRDDELRQRIDGKKVRGSDESGTESDSESDTDNSIVQADLEGLEDTAQDGTGDGSGLVKTRLGSMAFMQKAEAARKAANDAELRNLKRDLRGQNEDEQDFEDAGRQTFGARSKTSSITPIIQSNKSDFEERLSSDERDISREPSPITQNPLLQASQPRSAGMLKKPENNRGYAAVPNPNLKPRPDQQRSLNTQILDDSSSSSDASENENGMHNGRTKPATLSEAVFYGPDDVFDDFEKEKKDTMRDEDDQVIDNTLPGWGSWTGAGVSKRDQNMATGRFTTTIKGVAQDKRQDAKLDRVIINEKKVKKNDRYLATELPHPFESRQQYERSLRLPLGPEWTTKSTFQNATKPRVLVKQGIIRPMARPLA